jgi:chemotaxis protein MotB
MIASPPTPQRQAAGRLPLDLLPLDPPSMPVEVDKTMGVGGRPALGRAKPSRPYRRATQSNPPKPIKRGPVEVRDQEKTPEYAILLDPLSNEPDEQNQEAKQNQEEESLRLRTRPLGFFAQEEESPSFYLSLSDLMSLLLVFFVLIFSLTNPFAAPDGPSDSPHGVSQPELPVQMPEMIQLPNPQPLPAPITKGLLAVATAGSGDPGLISETKPVAAVSTAPKPRRSPTGSTDAFLDRALLRLVTDSKPVVPEAQIKEESRLSQLVAQMDAEVRAQTGPGVEVESRQDSLVVRLPEAITFDQGRAEIKPAMASVLGRLAEVLARRHGYRVVVTGHTDNVPIRNRDFASNWELSAARAAAVARALMAKGSNPSRFTISGQADQRPIASNASANGRQKNRRVEIELRPVG